MKDISAQGWAVLTGVGLLIAVFTFAMDGAISFMAIAGVVMAIVCAVGLVWRVLEDQNRRRGED